MRSEGARFPANLGKKKFSSTPSQQKRAGIVAHACHPSYCGKCKIGRMQFRPAWGKARPCLKNNQSKKG
jgi:hypothetical protein